jgi:sulfite reductase alpha subunit-like flavoprotein
MSHHDNTPASFDSHIATCHIFWSTQSGRAKACARRAARILREQTTVQLQNGMGCPFDDVSFLEFVSKVPPTTSLIIMFVSTTGDGEHCDSIQETWKRLLQKSLSAFDKPTPKFAMFCLGDRAYGPQFCAAGRKLAVRLLQLGMTTACEVGYGDDNTPNGGVFFDLDVWLEEQLLPILEKRAIDTVCKVPIDIVAMPYRVNVEEATDDISQDTEEWRQTQFLESYRNHFSAACPINAYQYDSRSQRIRSDIKATRQAPLLGTLTVNKRITAPDWEQDTRHLCIDIHSDCVEDDGLYLAQKDVVVSNLPYQAGDVASILPFNSEKEVERFLAVLPDSTSSLADKVIKIEVDESVMDNQFTKWPALCTLRGWLTYCADIQSLPEREDLRALSRYCSPLHELHKEQAEKLSSLSETSQSALYADYILREKRSWADVFYDFESLRSPGSKLTLEALLVLLPRMRPREFSIASSPMADQLLRTENHANESFSIELCVAVVKGTTRLGRHYHGLCSEYLSRMIPTKEHFPKVVMLWIRPGTFGKLPLDMDPSLHRFKVPVLCVGAGTGVAPMRSLILERNAVAAKARMAATGGDPSIETASSNPNDNILVFGCRSRSADYYYKDEWDTLQKDGMLRLITAFSRDQLQKVYVQRVLAEADAGSLVASHLLERGGAVYIAGGPKMARAVKEELVEALKKQVGDEKRANRLLAQLQKAGRFSVEAWS